ncbi:MAG: FtsK/SpoIIIE domain-containing protein, partial [Acidimicrobiia bacterium]|nr:FtsK/SpoIIIE domain-containing protein [Acidimicrobiia bacterium]
DGPHGLVAGTTGSGKSELLQTMIADLAARHSPVDLNVILIDYKGGSAFRACERLPHTVGFVTDLDDHLAARALVSLRAELRHRERELADMGVSDLAAMRSRFRHSVNADVVLPSLVIVIDEFAALRSEVPDFVDGLVDVAQRGRSMGVHMVLATQKPGGVVTPQIDANTNIRVALRVASAADSRDLIGVTDAAHIATDRPGRALLKIGGGGEVTEFQSAYVGGWSSPGGPVERVSGLATFPYGIGPGRLRAVDVRRSDDAVVEPKPAETRTDLERIVDAAVLAWNRSSGGRRLRRPWLPPLPALVPFEALGLFRPDSESEAPDGALLPAIGLADLPRAQTQEPFRLDLDKAGHVAIYGSPGSGKTSLLQTIACSLSMATDPVVIYGIEFGSGLGVIDGLPTVADIVSGGDLERLQLLMVMLEGEVSDRLQPSDSLGSSSPAMVGGTERRPRIVVLIDGFGPFWDALESFDFGRQADRFARLLSQAPSAGVHVVMTADQRSAVPYNCLGSIGLRLLQRLVSPDEYRSLGLTKPPDPESMMPGRTLVVGGPEVQAALVDDVGLARAAEVLRGRGVSAAGSPVRALSDVVGIEEIARPVSLSSVAVGLDPAHGEVTVDLVDQPTFLIAGATGSGRSTALLTMGFQLASVVDDRRALVPKRTSPLAVEPSAFSSVAVGDEVAAALVDLAAEIDQRSRAGYDRPMVIAVDDADVFFDDNRASAALNRVVLRGRDGGVVVLMSVSSFRAGTAYETWIRAVRSNGHGLILQPEGDKEEDLFDVRFPRGSALRFPVGRGYLVVRSTVWAVQVAMSAAGSGFGSVSASAPVSEGEGRMGG